MINDKCICRHLHSLFCELLKSRSLALEDFHVGLEQVFPFHAISPGHGAHQNGYIQVLERHLFLVSGNNLCG